MVELSETVIQAIPDLTLVVRRDGLVVSNLGGQETGIVARPGELLGKTLAQVWNQQIATEVGALILRTLKTRAPSEYEFEYEGQRFGLRVQPQRIDRVLIVVHRVSARAAARRDPLEGKAAVARKSGAGFPRQLTDAVEKARLRESRLALVTIHLGELREFEDAGGAPLGEQLIATSIRRVEAIEAVGNCARIEDDLLAVLLEDIPGHDAAGRIAEQIRRSLAEEIILEGRFFALVPTLGVAMYPGDGRESLTLLDSARGMTLEAQRAGRSNSVVFCSDTVPVRAFSGPDLGRELRWAVESEQFEVQYMPVIELAGRRTQSLDVVLRWVHPVCGLVPPEQYRPMLEAIHMEAALDRWALNKACRDLAELSRRGNTRQQVAVHLGREFLSTDTMTSDVEAALAASDITPARLVLNINLRSLVGGGRVREGLRQLRKCGIRVFLDEVGADGVPLGRLAHLPIDGLKIGRAFISRIEHDAGARAVCSSVISIASAFGLQSLATGVETRAQLDFLFERKCDQAQGPLFCTAKSIAELPGEVPQG